MLKSANDICVRLAGNVLLCWFKQLHQDLELFLHQTTQAKVIRSTELVEKHRAGAKDHKSGQMYINSCLITYYIYTHDFYGVNSIF